eukprot:15197598-Heterocapsa_arctica.AAC.1
MEGDQVWSTLLEALPQLALPQLVLHAIPYGISNAVEIEQRMAAWEHGTRNEEGYTSLLYRIHTQEAVSYTHLRAHET